MANLPIHSAQQVPTSLVEELYTLVDRPIRVMVVCGTQVRTLLTFSDEEILPEDLEIVAGPGCSICVMPAGHIDAFVKIGKQPDVITATCEDLLRVQGSRESLESIQRKGALVEVVDSPMEALDLARFSKCNSRRSSCLFHQQEHDAHLPGFITLPDRRSARQHFLSK